MFFLLNGLSMSDAILPDRMLGLFGDSSLGMLNLTGANWPILLPIILGFISLVYLLPRPKKQCLTVSIIFVLATFGSMAYYLVTGLGVALPVQIETVLFSGFASLAILFGLLMIIQRNPARSAIYFGVVILSVCGLFLLLAAPFLMAATVIVYAGAIVVTFLFVLMFSQQRGGNDADDRSREPFMASLVGFAILSVLLIGLQRVYDKAPFQEIIEKTERFANGDVLDQILLDPVSRQEYLTDVSKTLQRLRVHYLQNPNEGMQKKRNIISLETNPVQVTQEAIDQLRINLDSVPRIVDLEEIHSTCKEIAKGLHYLLMIRTGEVVPLAVIKQSPYSQTYSIAEEGKPSVAVRNRLPASNIAALGRTLYTDQLLSVEIAGTLLLIATIGAIAIARDKGEEKG